MIKNYCSVSASLVLVIQNRHKINVLIKSMMNFDFRFYIFHGKLSRSNCEKGLGQKSIDPRRYDLNVKQFSVRSAGSFNLLLVPYCEISAHS